MIQSAYHTDPGEVTGIASEFLDYRTVSISWGPPSPGPTNGYRVDVLTAGITETLNEHRLSFTTELPLGNHTIEVSALSQHFHSIPVLTSVTVRGEGICMYI